MRRAAMGGIDLTFSGTEHPLLHLLPLTPVSRHPASRRLLLSLRRIAFPPALSRLRGRCFFSHSRIPAGPPRYPRGYSPPFSVSARPSSRRPQRGRTTSNVKKLEAEACGASFVSSVSPLIRRHCSLFRFSLPIYTKESCRRDGM